MNKSKLTIWFLSVLLLMQWSVGVKAQAADIEYIKLENADSFIVRPQLIDMPDQQLQERINQAVFDDGGYPAYIAILNSLTDSAASGIRVEAVAKILKGDIGTGILTILTQADGRIGPGRPGYRYTALMYDMVSGERILAQDIFINEEDAVTGLNEAVTALIEPGMSDYLTPDELYPVPVDNLLLDETGITLYYDQSRFTTLSGRSGAINFHFDEITELLNTAEGSVINNIGVGKEPDDIFSSVELTAGQGRLPGLPAVIGEKTEEALSQYPPLFDSEAFPIGEKYQLEDARFRRSWLISDGEQITGILSYRMNLYGLLAGESSQTDLIKALGQPAATVVLDEDAASNYGLSAGQLYSYVFGDYTLQFNFDLQNILQAIWLNQSTL